MVGVSWNNYQEERWAKLDEPAIKAADRGRRRHVHVERRQSSAETQASNIENLISQGANVLVVLAQDGTAVKPSVASAISNGIPVIAYDRLIEDENALYITFDNVEVGRMQAQTIFDLVPSGNYIIIKGNQADANADFLRAGYEEVIGEAVTAGDITIVGETYTDNWDPAIAQTQTEQFLTAANNDVQAILSENDGMAGGVVAALEAQGLAGQVPVSGQDGDQAALNRVALGTQAVSVWKDARELGTAAGEAAIQLCANPDAVRGGRHRAVHDARGHRRDVDPAHAASHHPGQPRRRHRRGLDRHGQCVPGRGGWFGGRLSLTASTSVVERPSLRVFPGRGAPTLTHSVCKPSSTDDRGWQLAIRSREGVMDD